MIERIENLPDSASLIPLTRGTFVIVDTNLLRILNIHKWHLSWTKGYERYAMRTEKRKAIYMHREIMNAPDGMEVDHINGNGLDNRRENLRLCTRAQNRMNSVKRIGKSSTFKGVYWHKNCRKWRASLKLDGKEIHIGYFNTELEAAEAYDVEALYYFGNFAKTNFKDAANGTKNSAEHTHVSTPSDNPDLLAGV